MTKIKKVLLTILAVFVILASTFTAGRYSTPTKVVTKTVTQTQVVTQVQYKDKVVDRIVYVKVKDKKQDSHTVTVTDKKPDGEVVTTTTVDNHVDTKTNTDKNASATTQVSDNETQNVDKKSSTVTIKENDLPNWNIGVMAGLDTSRIDLHQPVSDLPFRVGLSLDRRIFGTFSVGVYGNVGTNASTLAPELGLRLSLGL